MPVYLAYITGRTEGLNNSFMLELIILANSPIDAKAIARGHDDFPDPALMRNLQVHISPLGTVATGHAVHRSATLDAYRAAKENL